MRRGRRESRLGWNDDWENDIKERRRQLRLTSHRDLRVGECVPFYFCPRSVMLYVIRHANHPKLTYRGG